MLTCSTDNIVGMFNLNLKGNNQPLQEEDAVDGCYSSEQPLVDCGYFKEYFWA